MRHKLIPTRRDLAAWYRSWYVLGAQEALAEAREFYESEGVPVLVVEAPEGGVIMKPIATVDLKEERTKARRKVA